MQQWCDAQQQALHITPWYPLAPLITHRYILEPSCRCTTWWWLCYLTLCCLYKFWFLSTTLQCPSTLFVWHGLLKYCLHGLASQCVAMQPCRPHCLVMCSICGGWQAARPCQCPWWVVHGGCSTQRIMCSICTAMPTQCCCSIGVIQSPYCIGLSHNSMHACSWRVLPTQRRATPTLIFIGCARMPAACRCMGSPLSLW